VEGEVSSNTEKGMGEVRELSILLSWEKEKYFTRAIQEL
jgi:hypothetical protein